MHTKLKIFTANLTHEFYAPYAEKQLYMQTYLKIGRQYFFAQLSSNLVS